MAERIAGGPIPFEEARDIAIKITEALEEAHERGIVHRDLKPANVKLTPDGKVKVLDFGLAKALVDETPELESSMSPTLTRDATRIGVILGTAAYMSPEQAKAKRVDRRTDILAFGAVVYEMLTTRKAFTGENISDVLAAVIKSEPRWDVLPASTPPRIHDLVRKCLRKNAARRLQHIGDARVELEDSETSEVEVVAVTVPSRRPAALGFVAGLLTALVLFWATRGRLNEAPAPGLWKTSIFGGTPRRLASSAYRATVSSDGSIAYLSSKQSSARQIFVTGPDGENPQSVVNAEDGESFWELAWSPDGQWLLFGTWKIEGGESLTIQGIRIETGERKVVLEDARLFQNGRAVLPFLWTPDGRLIYGRRERPPNQQSSNLWSISIGTDTTLRGEPSRLTQLTGVNFADLPLTANGAQLVFLSERNRRNVWHVTPQASPDGCYLAFAAMTFSANAWTLEDF